MKVLILTTAIAIAYSTTAFADASNGKGDGKGRTNVGAAVSAEPGGANVASGLKGGWGSAGGISNGTTATPKN